jgi:hypothetical protein
VVPQPSLLRARPGQAPPGLSADRHNRIQVLARAKARPVGKTRRRQATPKITPKTSAMAGTRS